MYAYLHHRKWYLRKMAERAAWEAQYRQKYREPVADAAEPPAPSRATGD